MVDVNQIERALGRLKSVEAELGDPSVLRDRLRYRAVLVDYRFLKRLDYAYVAYQLGEDYAMNMGVNIKRFRFFLVLLSSLLAATVTAFAGPISFVGIAVPHIVKRVLGTAKPIAVIPGCFLGGAIFCLLCDLIARTVFSPTELSISSVTAVFGAPIVISIMIRRRREH